MSHLGVVVCKALQLLQYLCVTKFYLIHFVGSDP